VSAPSTRRTTTATVADALHLANGIAPAETDRVIAAFGRLDERLRSFPAGTVTLQLSVKERDTPSQRTTLEAHVMFARAALIAVAVPNRCRAPRTVPPNPPGHANNVHLSK
jgi:hypothetical protein